MEKRGFSLIELLIVIALIGILLAIAVPNYRDTMTKSKIEKQTKELHSIIMGARLSAMQNRQPVALFLGPTLCVYQVYTSLDYGLFNNNSPPTGLRAPGKTTVFPYAMSQKPPGTTMVNLNVANDYVSFDHRGFAIGLPSTDNQMTLVVNPLKSYGGDNCIVVSTSRTNIGRMENASTCRTR
jgi:prepilin-type N-terminal cleavage/methylation domain-containing protein